MNCEEFEKIGLGLDRESPLEDAAIAIQRQDAIEHANGCPRCAALQESWTDAQMELRALRESTQRLGAPLRVEMRLRQEFHTRHRTLKLRAAAVMVSWALAGAAVLIGAVSWWNWHLAQTLPARMTAGSPPNKALGIGAPVMAPPQISNSDTSQNGSANQETLVADNDAEDFTVLPGSLPQETGDAAVVRVRLQRGALGALGLPVNETRAGEWIQVDLFVGQDGQPQAVRLPR
jgi:hypothetical protein